MAENNPQKTKALALPMKKTDKENQQFVAWWLDNCGCPKGLSAENNQTIFLVIGHGEKTLTFDYQLIGYYLYKPIISVHFVNLISSCNYIRIIIMFFHD